MIHVTGDYFVTHKGLIPVDFIDKYVRDEDETVYEVLRVIGFKPLFLEDHLLRFFNSFTSLNRDKPQKINNLFITDKIKSLIGSHNLPDGNIRFQFNKNDVTQFCAWYIPVTYPSEQQYSKGVAVQTLSATRPDPNIKTRDKKLRQQADNFIKTRQIYEAILVNREGYLTEGSRSNIFFISDNTFYTPPLSCVLPGITRQKIIHLLEDNHLSFKEKMIHSNELHRYQSCFITGTSANILPVAKIDNISMDVETEALKNLVNLYKLLIDNYLQEFKWPTG